MTYIMTNPAGCISGSSNYIIDISKPIHAKKRTSTFLRKHPSALLLALFIVAPIAILISLFLSVSAVILPIAWVLGLL